MKILVTLCARGGSKGIPGKNIKVINGYPLIYYSISIAKRFCAKYDADLILSSDDIDIKLIASNYGLHTNYTRPPELALDSTGKIETISHVIEFAENNNTTKYDYILDLDVSSPLRTMEDLENAFELIKNDSFALNLFSVNSANRNPYFNMVEKQSNGYYGLVKKGNFLTRQSAPNVYELNASFYFYRRKFFEDKDFKTITERSLIYVMPHLCFDLDHQIDFEFMEYLLVSNKLGFYL